MFLKQMVLALLGGGNIRNLRALLQAKVKLQRALVALDTAEHLGQDDALLMNSRGNAFSLLQMWGEALEAYKKAADLSPRDFESIPLSNQD